MKLLSLLTALFTLITSMWNGMIMNTKNIYTRTSDSVSAAENSGETVIDKWVHYQTLNGFGCSGAWWAQEVGKWDNAGEIISLLYDKEDGIGLNIYRYNVGAGSEDDDSIYTVINRTESFLNGDGTLDFSKDAAARNALSLARQAAGKDLRVTLFSNSAPVSMTINGKSYCDPKENGQTENTTNLSADKYDDFADYLYSVADFFVKDGYRVTGVSPVNEPQYDWCAWYNSDGSISAKQEGCYYSPTEARDLYKAFVNKFNNSLLDIKGVKIEMFDSGEAEPDGCTSAIYLDTILSDKDEYKNDNKILRNYFDSASTHSYWSSTDKKLWTSWYLKDNYKNLKIACTEYCQMTNDRNTGVYDLFEKNGMSKGLGIEYGVAMAKVIADDMTLLNATEWDWWLGCSFGDYTDGLIYVDSNNHESVETSKRLWCLGNFSKFTTEGSVRIAATSGNENLPCVAYLNPDRSVTVVYVNNTNEDISTAYTSGGNADFYLTDATHDLEEVSFNAQNFTVPAMSVLTMVISNSTGC